MENTTPEAQPVPQETLHSKIIKHKKVIIISGVLTVVVVGLFFIKGLFVAAVVNGMPISRMSVIKELEKQSGKQVLESLINKRLMEAELNKEGITITSEEVDGEIEKIEAQVASQGGTLKDALAMQGMTEEQLREQIVIQKKLEKLLADKIMVSDEEITGYITDNKIAIPKDITADSFKERLGAQLSQQKLQEEAQKWISELTTNAKIKYFVNY